MIGAYRVLAHTADIYYDLRGERFNRNNVFKVLNGTFCALNILTN